MKFFGLFVFLALFDLYAHKIVGLVPARNEEDIVAQCLKCLSFYIDAIIFLDDASADNTLKIVKGLTKACRIERMIRKEKLSQTS